MFKKLLAFLLICVLAVGAYLYLFEYVPHNTYKVMYSDEVTKYSEEFGIDEAFVYAVIRTESNFNPNAVSDAGAIGLMQIIEDSFDWVSTKLHETDLEYDDMFTPEYSIKFGCYMLSYLYNKYESYELAAAAYHSGMGEVDGWLSSGKVDKSSFEIADFKGSNTRFYVKKIMKAYKVYSELK